MDTLRNQAVINLMAVGLPRIPEDTISNSRKSHRFKIIPKQVLNDSKQQTLAFRGWPESAAVVGIAKSLNPALRRCALQCGTNF